MDRQQFYIIYRITSPSGKSYVGLTKSSLRERWRQHVNRAENESRNHPFYNAIRKYGANAFTIEHIASALGARNAQAVEIICISQESKRYNLSAGGENDGAEGSKIFWGRMRSDPEAMELYRANLVAAQRSRPPLDKESQTRIRETAAQWRKDNPREAWANSYRASRIAKRNSTGVTAALEAKRAAKPLKERLLAKHKSKFLSRARAVTKIWATRADSETLSIGEKISETLKQRYRANPTVKAAVSRQLAEARKCMDRKKQGERASSGLKNYWEELRRDPEKYAAYMKRRTESLMRTIAEKQKCV